MSGNFTRPTIAVQVAFANNPLTALASLTWTDITAYVQSIKTKRGRQHELNRVEVGTASLRLTNTDGRFNPFNTTSPYYGPYTDGTDTGVSGLVPMKRIRIQATWPLSGGTTYTIWTGYVTAWPNTMVSASLNYVDINCEGAFKLLALRKLTVSQYKTLVTTDGATSYWRLGESIGSITFADSVGSNSITASGNPVLGIQGALLTDPDTAVKADGSWSAVGPNNIISGAAAYSVEFWVNVPVSMDTTDGTFSVLVEENGNAFPTMNFQLVHDGGANNGQIKWRPFDDAGNVITVLSGAVNTGGWHHIVGVRSSDGKTHTLYTDGVLSNSGATPNVGTFSATQHFDIAARFVVNLNATTQRGFSLDEIAVYNAVALTATQVANHYNAGIGGFLQQSSDTRISKLLAAAGWPSADYSSEAGKSTITQETVSLTNTQALQPIYDVTDTENGLFFEGADGTLKFFARTHLVTNTNSNTSQLTLSDVVGGSNEPWELQGTIPAMDDLDVYNDVLVQRVGGVAQRVGDTTSQNRYGTRALQKTNYKNTLDSACTDAANYLLSRYKTPIERVRSITIHPLDDPNNLWPQVLNRDLWDRVTTTWTPFGGGTALSQAQLIEGIEHEIRPDGDWITIWRLSAADTQTYWIMGDAVYGKIGQTTRVFF